MASLRRPIARFRPSYPSPSVYLSAYRRYLDGLVPGNGPRPIGFASYLEWLENRQFLSEQEATAAFQNLWQTTGSWSFTPFSVTHTNSQAASLRTAAQYYHCDFQFQVGGTGEITVGIRNTGETLQGVYMVLDGLGGGQVYTNATTSVGNPFSYTADDTFIISSVKGAFTVTKDGVEIASGTSPAGPFYGFMTSDTAGDSLVAPSFLLVYVRWWLLAGGAQEAPQWALSKVSASRKVSSPATAMWLDGEEDVRITFTPSNVTVSDSLLVGLTRDLVLDPSFGQAIRFSPGTWEALNDDQVRNISGTWQEGDVFQIASSGGRVIYSQSGGIIDDYDLTNPSVVTKYGFVQPSVSNTGVVGWVNEYYPPPYWYTPSTSNFESLNLSDGVRHILPAEADSNYVYSTVFPKVGSNPASNVTMTFRVTNLSGDADVGFIQNRQQPNAQTRLFFNNASHTLGVVDMRAPLESRTIPPSSPLVNPANVPFEWSNGSRYRVSLFSTLSQPYFLVEDASTGGLVWGGRVINPDAADDATLDVSPLSSSSNRAYVGMVAAPNSISLETYEVATATLSDWVAYPGMTVGSNTITMASPAVQETDAESTSLRFNGELRFQFASTPSGGAIALSRWGTPSAGIGILGDKILLTDLTTVGNQPFEVATVSLNAVYAFQIQSDEAASNSGTSRYVLSTVSNGTYSQIYAVPLVNPLMVGQITPLLGPFNAAVGAEVGQKISLCNLSFTTISSALAQTRWSVFSTAPGFWMTTDNFVVGDAGADDYFRTQTVYEDASVGFAADSGGEMALGWTTNPPIGDYYLPFAESQLAVVNGTWYVSGSNGTIYPDTRFSWNLSGGTSVNWRVFDLSQDVSGIITISAGELRFYGAAPNATGNYLRYFQLSGSPAQPYWLAPLDFSGYWTVMRSNIALTSNVEPPANRPYIVSRVPASSFILNFAPFTIGDISTAEIDITAEAGITTVSDSITGDVKIQMYTSNSAYYYNARVGNGSWTEANTFSLQDTFSLELSNGVVSLYKGPLAVAISGSDLSASIAGGSYYAYFAGRCNADQFNPITWPSGNIPTLPVGWWITTGSGWTQSVSDGYLTISHAGGAGGSTHTATSANSISSDRVFLAAFTAQGRGTIGVASNGTFYDSVDFNDGTFTYRGVTDGALSTDGFILVIGSNYSLLEKNGVVVNRGPIINPPSKYFGYIELASEHNATFSTLSLVDVRSTSNDFWTLVGDWSADYFTLSRNVVGDDISKTVYSANDFEYGEFSFKTDLTGWNDVGFVGVTSLSGTEIPNAFTFYPAGTHPIHAIDSVYLFDETGGGGGWDNTQTFSVKWSPDMVRAEIVGTQISSTQWRLDSSGNSLSGTVFVAASASSGNLTFPGTYTNLNSGFVPIFQDASGWTQSLDPGAMVRVVERSGGGAAVSTQSVLNVEYGQIQVMQSNTQVNSRFLLGISESSYIGLEYAGSDNWYVRAPELFLDDNSNMPIAHTISGGEGLPIAMKLVDGLYEVLVDGVSTVLGHAWFDASLRYIVSLSAGAGNFYGKDVRFNRLASTAAWQLVGSNTVENNLALWNHSSNYLQMVGSPRPSPAPPAAPTCNVQLLPVREATNEVCFTVSHGPSPANRNSIIGFQSASSGLFDVPPTASAYFLVKAGGTLEYWIRDISFATGVDPSGASLGLQYTVSGEWRQMTAIATPAAGSPYSNTLNLIYGPYGVISDLSWTPFVSASQPGATFDNISITEAARLDISTDASGNTPFEPPVFTPQWVYDATVWNVTGTMGTGFTIERTGDIVDGSSNIYWNVSYVTGMPYMTVSVMESSNLNERTAKFGFTNEVGNIPDYTAGNTAVSFSNYMGELDYAVQFGGTETGTGTVNGRKLFLWASISGRGTAEAGTDGTEVFKAATERSDAPGMFYAQSEEPNKFFVTISTNAPNFYGSVSGWNGATTEGWVVRNRTSNVFLRSLTNITSNAILNTSGYAYPSITFTVSGADNSTYSEVGFNRGFTFDSPPTIPGRRALRIIPTMTSNSYSIKVYEDDEEVFPLGTADSSTVCRIDFSGTSEVRYTSGVGTESECNTTMPWDFGESNIRAYATGQGHSNTQFLIDSYAPMDTSGWTLVKNGWQGAGPLTSWSVNGLLGSPQTLQRAADRLNGYPNYAVTASNVSATPVFHFTSNVWDNDDIHYIDIGITPSKTSLSSASWMRFPAPLNESLPAQSGSPAEGTVDLWSNGTSNTTWIGNPGPSGLDSIMMTYSFGVGPTVTFQYSTDGNPSSNVFSLDGVNIDSSFYFFIRTDGANAITFQASNA